MAFTVATFIAFTVLVAVLSWWKTRDDDLSTQGKATSSRDADCPASLSPVH